MYDYKNIYYGWILCVLGFLCITALTSIMYSFGVFLEPIRTDLAISERLTSLIFSVNQFLVYTFAAIIGFSADRRNTRRLLLFGTICSVIGLIGTGLFPSYIGIFLSYSILLSIGFGSIYVTIYAVIARWFYQRRGVAMSILSVGFGAGGLIGPPIADRFLQYLTWNQVFLVVAIPILLIFSLSSYLFRDNPLHDRAHKNIKNSIDKNQPHQSNDPLTIREVSLSQRYWLLSSGLLLSTLGFFILIVHFVPYATSLGISETIAAGTLGLIGGASIPARFGAGFVSDYIGRLPILVSSAVLMSLSLFGIVVTTNQTTLVIFATIFGIGYGGFNALYSPFVADVFTASNAGRMLGLTGISFAIGGAFGPAVSSYLYQITGAYDLSFSIAGLFGMIGAVLIVLSNQW